MRAAGLLTEVKGPFIRGVRDPMRYGYGFYGDTVLGGQGREGERGDVRDGSGVNYPRVVPTALECLLVVDVDLSCRAYRPCLDKGHDMEWGMVVIVVPASCHSAGLSGGDSREARGIGCFVEDPPAIDFQSGEDGIGGRTGGGFVGTCPDGCFGGGHLVGPTFRLLVAYYLNAVCVRGEGQLIVIRSE